ncbi:MAG: sulfite exporter TauE/SafE family protein [Proteobacteria bacterium]|nr:sulfite exporter TauE/SafE family protein [Pseudomonadota bacterium]MBU1712772.1 sulfite exporter TauE/SafE family protein [Pseudomonadota bacterium]
MRSSEEKPEKNLFEQSMTGIPYHMELLIIIFAVFGSAVIKNGVGIGAGIFMLPFLSLVLSPKVALGLGAPAMLVSDIVGIWNYWKEWDNKELALLVPPAVLGVVLGAVMIQSVPTELFKLLVGITAVLFPAYRLVKMKWPPRIGTPQRAVSYGGRPLTMLSGFLGGAASTLIHAGGMVMSIYLIQKQTDNRRFVGTFVLFFTLINLMKLATYIKIGILQTQMLLLVVALSPMIVLGGLVGNRLNKKIPLRLFRIVVLSLILAIGVRLLTTL